MQGFLRVEDLYAAYARAKKGKSSKPQVRQRDTDSEKNIEQLYWDIVSGSYTISQTKRFIICDPVPREIIALAFRDRIVQHLIHNYLYPLFEPQWIYDSYSNRIGKGTLFGVRRVDHFMRSCSRNYTTDCTIMKLDIQSFFLSINKGLLWNMLTQKIFAARVDRDKSLVLGLLQKIIFHDYLHNCNDITTPYHRSLLPTHKMMKNCKLGCGLPLGNLTSHLFANIYMNLFDQWVKHELGMRYYGRYVDDFVVMHPVADELIAYRKRMQEFLMQSLQLTLHPHKLYLQHYTKGVQFLGVFIKPRHRLPGKRTIGAVKTKITQRQHGSRIPMEKVIASVNSYLGLTRHHHTFAMRKSRCERLPGRIQTKIRFGDEYYKIIQTPPVQK